MESRVVGSSSRNEPLQLQPREHIRGGTFQHKNDRKKFVIEGESNARTYSGDQPDYGQLAFCAHINTQPLLVSHRFR